MTDRRMIPLRTFWNKESVIVVEGEGLGIGQTEDQHLLSHGEVGERVVGVLQMSFLEGAPSSLVGCTNIEANKDTVFPATLGSNVHNIVEYYGLTDIRKLFATNVVKKLLTYSESMIEWELRLRKS
ncbi:hypothetical protein Tco_1058729 [Tanacetum coccineum]|uniref:Uncharacterized protein n=1 Tax=Tanacetum coccineum TaxID=301880 RepID=A0ABQ5HAU4_9ASTR